MKAAHVLYKKKHKQTNASYPAMNISYIPPDVRRSRSRERALNRDASQAGAHVLGPPPSRVEISN